MKKILIYAASLTFFTAQAMADGIYIAGKLGGSHAEAKSIDLEPQFTIAGSHLLSGVTENDFTDNAFSLGGALGYTYTQWHAPLRMEVEYLYRNHYNYQTHFMGPDPSLADQVTLDSQVNTQTILANFFIDLPLSKMFGIFFGAGLGEAISTTDSNSPITAFPGEMVEGSIDDAAFSWMATVGLMVSPVEWLTFDLSYRYSDLREISWRTGSSSIGATVDLQTKDFTAQEIYLGMRVLLPNMVNSKGTTEAVEGIYIAGKFGGSIGEASGIEMASDFTVPSITASVSEKGFTNTVYSWGGALGYEYNHWLVPLRMEVEYLRRNRYDYDTGFVDVTPAEATFKSYLNTQTILANFYMDVPIADIFGIFFGAGLGESITTTHSSSPSQFYLDIDLDGTIDDTSFSWMATAGLTVKPLKWLAFDLSYRYADLGDIKWRTGSDVVGEVLGLETDVFMAQEMYFGIRVMVP